MTIKQDILSAKGAAEIGNHTKEDGTRYADQTLVMWGKVAALIPEGMNRSQGKEMLRIMREKGLSNSVIRTYCTILKQFGMDIKRPKRTESKPFFIPPEYTDQFMNEPLVIGLAVKKHEQQIEGAKLMLKIGINSCLRTGDMFNIASDKIQMLDGEPFFIINHRKRRKNVLSPIYPQLWEDIDLAKSAWKGNLFHPSMRMDHRKGVKVSDARKRQILKEALARVLVDLGIHDKTTTAWNDQGQFFTTYGEHLTTRHIRPTGANWLLYKGIPFYTVKEIGGWEKTSTVFEKHYSQPNIRNLWTGK